MSLRILLRSISFSNPATAGVRLPIARPVAEKNAVHAEVPGIQRRGFILGSLATLALAYLGCEGESPVPNCNPISVGLNANSVSIEPFNDAAASLTVEAGGEVLRLTTQAAKDPGVVIVPANQDGWRLDCHTGLSFEVRGQITSGFPRLDIQIYLQGDDPSIPSVSGQNIPFAQDWTTQVVQIPRSLIESGRNLVVKIQPLVVGDVSNVDIYFRNVEFV